MVEKKSLFFSQDLQPLSHPLVGTTAEEKPWKRQKRSRLGWDLRDIGSSDGRPSDHRATLWVHRAGQSRPGTGGQSVECPFFPKFSQIQKMKILLIFKVLKVVVELVNKYFNVERLKFKKRFSRSGIWIGVPSEPIRGIPQSKGAGS